jgi:hypothetical protein
MPDPILTVPAPWGLPIMLGLQPTWQVAWPLAVGQRLQIQHGPSGPDFSKVLAWCEANMPPHKRLMDLVPWNLLLPGHLLGTVQIVACDPPDTGRPSFLMHLKDPQPAWATPSPQPPNPTGWAKRPLDQPSSPARPGPLFGTQ